MYDVEVPIIVGDNVIMLRVDLSHFIVLLRLDKDVLC